MTHSVGGPGYGRWAALLHKQERALAAAAMHDYGKSLHFARSARHDLAALSGLLSSAARQLNAKLECFEDAPLAVDWFVWAALVVAVVAFVAVQGTAAVAPWWKLRVAKQF